MDADFLANWTTQMRKGLLELCVLELLSRGDTYGYQITSRLAADIEIGEGTVYPLMKRMQNDGMVSTYLVESASGPPRASRPTRASSPRACRRGSTLSTVRSAPPPSSVASRKSTRVGASTAAAALAESVIERFELAGRGLPGKRLPHALATTSREVRGSLRLL